jgi:hypothetical protein
MALPYLKPYLPWINFCVPYFNTTLEPVAYNAKVWVGSDVLFVQLK